MQAQGVEAQLEGAHVEGLVGPPGVLPVGRQLVEDRGGAVASRLGQDLLGQLEHEVGQRLRGLVGDRGVDPALAFEPGAHLHGGHPDHRPHAPSAAATAAQIIAHHRGTVWEGERDSYIYAKLACAPS